MTSFDWLSYHSLFCLALECYSCEGRNGDICVQDPEKAKVITCKKNEKCYVMRSDSTRSFGEDINHFFLWFIQTTIFLVIINSFLVWKFINLGEVNGIIQNLSLNLIISWDLNIMFVIASTCSLPNSNLKFRCC